MVRVERGAVENVGEDIIFPCGGVYGFAEGRCENADCAARADDIRPYSVERSARKDVGEDIIFPCGGVYEFALGCGEYADCAATTPPSNIKDF